MLPWPSSPRARVRCSGRAGLLGAAFGAAPHVPDMTTDACRRASAPAHLLVGSCWGPARVLRKPEPIYHCHSLREIDPRENVQQCVCTVVYVVVCLYTSVECYNNFEYNNMSPVTTMNDDSEEPRLCRRQSRDSLEQRNGVTDEFHKFATGETIFTFLHRRNNLHLSERPSHHRTACCCAPRSRRLTNKRAREHMALRARPPPSLFHHRARRTARALCSPVLSYGGPVPGGVRAG